MIRVENRFLGQLAFDHIGEAVTTKEGDGHGYGLKNMRSAARKYGGEVSVETREGRFILTVVIPMSDSGGEEVYYLVSKWGEVCRGAREGRHHDYPRLLLTQLYT